MKKIAWVVLLVMGVGATTGAFAQAKQNKTVVKSNTTGVYKGNGKKLNHHVSKPVSQTVAVSRTKK